MLSLSNTSLSKHETCTPLQSCRQIKVRQCREYNRWWYSFIEPSIISPLIHRERVAFVDRADGSQLDECQFSAMKFVSSSRNQRTWFRLPQSGKSHKCLKCSLIVDYQSDIDMDGHYFDSAQFQHARTIYAQQELTYVISVVTCCYRASIISRNRCHSSQWPTYSLRKRSRCSGFSRWITLIIS